MLTPIVILSLLLMSCSGEDPVPLVDAGTAGDMLFVPDMQPPAADAAQDMLPALEDAGTFRSPLVLMPQLAGLWTGPAAQTPLGDFRAMTIDFRPADPNVLFGRTDLDADNSLRMAFYIELLRDAPDFVFRNGGLFEGISRDTKAALETYDFDSGVWRFCEPELGCEYLDATITVDDDQLEMDVKVRGQQHLLWTAERVEPRAVPDRFPALLDALGTNITEFPPMPSLATTLTWTDPAPAGALAWLTLSTTPCGVTGTGCVPSRTFRAEVDEGSTAVELQIEQLHAGTYHVNAVIDRDGNFATTRFPASPDTVVFPVDPVVDVPSEGATTSHDASFEVP